MENKFFQITELERRVQNLIRIGVVCDADYENARLKIKLGNNTTAWLPWLENRAGNNRTWAPLEIDEQVLVLSSSGNLTQGIVLGSIYRLLHPQPSIDVDSDLTVYQDGAEFEYHREQHRWRVSLPAGGTTEIISDGGLVITGDVTVNGSIHATGDVSDATRSMADDRNIYNSHNHPGDSGGTTNVPNQPQ